METSKSSRLRLILLIGVASCLAILVACYIVIDPWVVRLNFVRRTFPAYVDGLGVYDTVDFSRLSDPNDGSSRERLVVYFDRSMNTSSFNPGEDIAVEICALENTWPCDNWQWVAPGDVVVNESGIFYGGTWKSPEVVQHYATKSYVWDYTGCPSDVPTYNRLTIYLKNLPQKRLLRFHLKGVNGNNPEDVQTYDYRIVFIVDSNDDSPPFIERFQPAADSGHLFPPHEEISITTSEVLKNFAPLLQQGSAALSDDCGYLYMNEHHGPTFIVGVDDQQRIWRDCGFDPNQDYSLTILADSLLLWDHLTLHPDSCEIAAQTALGPFDLQSPLAQDLSGNRLSQGVAGPPIPIDNRGFDYTDFTLMTPVSSPFIFTSTFRTAPIKIDERYSQQDGNGPLLTLTPEHDFQLILADDNIASITSSILDADFLNPLSLSYSCTLTSSTTASCASPFATGVMPPPARYYRLRFTAWDSSSNDLGYDQMTVRFDRDGDGLPDYYEVLHACLYLNIPDADVSSDLDSMTNLQEYRFSEALDPCDEDTDHDGLSDDIEVWGYGSSPLNSDTDSDGMPDGWEAGCLLLNENDAAGDHDGDGLINIDEYAAGTEPCSADTDNDGSDDLVDCDPLDPDNWISCLECTDSDSDGSYIHCDAYVNRIGPDCNDANTFAWSTCSTCIDNDGDGSLLACDRYSLTPPVTIGFGTYPLTTPLSTNNLDHRLQSIYLASEIGRAGAIYSIAIDVKHVSPQILNNFTIRIKNTSLSGYSHPSWDAPDSGWTTVYQANEPPGAVGWHTFHFMTPFQYDGISNIIVDFSFSNSFSTSIFGEVNSSVDDTCRSLRSLTYDEVIDPLNWMWATGIPICVYGHINLRINFTDTIEGPDCNDNDPFNWISCTTCSDVDFDLRNGTNCDIPEDCNDTISNAWNTCQTCRDTDGDGWYKVCNHYTGINGPDCNDSYPNAWDTCNTCIDADADGWYKTCNAYIGIMGPDCDDTDNNMWDTCETCVDLDDDGWYLLCNNYNGINGTDCNDADVNNWTSCATCMDNDNDGQRGTNCDVSADCNDADTNNWISCGTCLDEDLDTWFANCDRYFSIVGPDCDPAKPVHWNDCETCIDLDLDGHGINCNYNFDCDEFNPYAWNSCLTCIDPDGDGWYGVCDQTSYPYGTSKSIGFGTNSTDLPFSTNYNTCRTELIYLASEIGQAGTINALALDMTAPPGQMMNNLTIRLKHTNLSSHAIKSWEGPNTGWTIVYQANQVPLATGWQTFIFSTPFPYNGTQNLMVDISYKNSSLSTAGNARYTGGYSNRSIYYRTNNDLGDPLTWVGTSSPIPISWGYILNLRLSFPSSINSVDCNPTDPAHWNDCATCIDSDSDNRGDNCNLGLDCNDLNPNTWDTCTTCVDIDDDGSYLLCNDYTGIDGPDCNDANDRTWDTCATCKDNDFDSWYGVCNDYTGINDGLNPDCDDESTFAWSKCDTCVDNDLDGYYSDCDRYIADLRTITVGTGTSDINIPLTTSYPDTRLQTIYRSSYLGRAGTISSLALDVTKVPERAMNNFTIRMKNTSLSSHSPAAWEGPDSGWTTVYQANQAPGVVGWQTYTFTTPFEFNGTSNLMVDFSFNNRNKTAPDGMVRYSSAGYGASIYYKDFNNAYTDPIPWIGPSNPTPAPWSNFVNIRVALREHINGPDCNDFNPAYSQTCLPDADNDGLSDIREHFDAPCTCPCGNSPDSDGDGLCDGAATVTGVCVGGEDLNDDGTVGPSESDPCDPDSDDDGLNDFEEVKTYKTNPLVADTDGDQISDYREVKVLGTNPKLVDTDGDGLSDYVEMKCAQEPPGACTYQPATCIPLGGCIGETDPRLRDTDGDGLPDNSDPHPFQSDAPLSSVAFSFEQPGATNGRVGEFLNVDINDPLSTHVLFKATVIPQRANELVAFKVTQTNDPASTSVFCNSTGIDCGTIFYALTDASGNAYATLKFGQKTFTGATPTHGHYLYDTDKFPVIAGDHTLRVTAMPLAGATIGANFSSEIRSYPGPAASIEPIQTGLPGFKYVQSNGSPVVKVTDLWGNPVANAIIQWTVAGGNGKVINMPAQQCRDMGKLPFAPQTDCSTDDHTALSIEIPAALDVYQHYPQSQGPCNLEPSGSSISVPAGYNPDAQCTNTLYWSDSNGRAATTWVLGDEDPQALQASIPGTPLTLTMSGTATDLQSGQVLPRILSLSSRANSSIQNAGSTFRWPFRAVLFYRWPSSSCTPPQCANPVVRIDDDLISIDKPDETFGVQFTVSNGGISELPVRNRDDLSYIILPLVERSDGVDLASAYWHSGCLVGLDSITVSGTVGNMPSGYYSTLNFNIIDPGSCIERDQLSLTDSSGAPIDMLPHSPDTFRIVATSSSVSTDPITVALVLYDQSGTPIDQGEYAADPIGDPFTILVDLYYDPIENVFSSNDIEMLEESGVAYVPRLMANQAAASDTTIKCISKGMYSYSIIMGPGASSIISTSKLYFTLDPNTSTPISFDTVIGETIPIFLKLELNHGNMAAPGVFFVSGQIKEPGYEAVDTFSLPMNKMSDSGGMATYLSPFPRPGNGEDSTPEFMIMDNFIPRPSQLFAGFSKGYGFASRGEGIYPSGTQMIDGRRVNCDDPGRPCSTAGEAIRLAFQAMVNDPNRIKSNQLRETPKLSKELFLSGGVQIGSAWMTGYSQGSIAKIWLHDQADVTLYQGHGAIDGTIFMGHTRVGPLDLISGSSNLWFKDVNTVINMGCNTLSLCEDHEDAQGKPTDHDPKCKVKIVSDSTTTYEYSPYASPTDDNCHGAPSSCDGPTLNIANQYGGQRWADLARKYQHKPLFYLGYYTYFYFGGNYNGEYIDYGDAYVIRKFFDELNNRTLSFWDGGGIAFSWVSANAFCSTPEIGCPYGMGAATYAGSSGEYFALVWEDGMWKYPEGSDFYRVEPIYYSLRDPSTITIPTP